VHIKGHALGKKEINIPYTAYSGAAITFPQNIFAGSESVCKANQS